MMELYSAKEAGSEDGGSSPSWYMITGKWWNWNTLWS